MDEHYQLSAFLSRLTENEVPKELVRAIEIVLKTSEKHSRSIYFADPESILINKRDLHHCLIFFRQRARFYYAKGIIEQRTHNLILKRIIASVDMHLKQIA